MSGVIVALLLLAGVLSAADTEALRILAKARIGTPDPATIDYPDGVAPSTAQIDLGRTLFFDPRLSATGTISCATCHNPDLGLGDGLARRQGLNDTLADRHTPPLYNLAWNHVFFWDGRADSLEHQAMGPIQSPGEMAMDLPALVRRLEQVSWYRTAFTAAFASPGIDAERIARAVAAFERTLVSRDSPFDRWLAGDDRALGPEAIRGLALFTGKASCIACHSGPNLSDESFHRLGLPGADPGRTRIVPGAAATGAFKTPGLRNSALTAPYMHDGSLASLEAVVRFYNRGGDAPTSNPLVRKLGLSEAEIADVVAFLGALTDPVLVVRPAIPSADRP